MFDNTVRTRIIELQARTLELSLLVRSGSFSFFREPALAVLSPPYPGEEVLDVLAPGSIIRALTVMLPCFAWGWGKIQIAGQLPVPN